MEHSSKLIYKSTNVFFILLIGFIGEESNALDSGLDMMSQNMDVSNSESGPNTLKRTPGQLWFGPRLGRKKRMEAAEEDEDALIDRLLSNEETIVDFLREYPWSFIPTKGNSQETSTRNFTPRLGRNSEEVRGPPFSPRLGRRRKILPFRPRLGRELLEVERPIDRYTRSVSSQPEVDVKH